MIAFWIISLLASVAYLLMQGMLAWGWVRRPAKREEKRVLPALSVVIAARNEADNLRRNLPSILEQGYPDFEVVVVLDRCEDGSEEVLREMQLSHPHLRLLRIDATAEGWAPKKWALTEGIQAARNACLVFTDADCEAEAHWLTAMGGCFARGKEVILGLGLYRQYPGWLNRLIRWETFYSAFQYIGAAGLGLPYMGVGRNLAYLHSLWEKNRGFEAFKSSLSGDDDLFVNAYAAAATTATLLAPGSRTWSEPHHTWGGWIRQKVRHISASVRYKPATQLLLGTFHLAHIAFYGSLGLGWALGAAPGGLIALYLGRILASWYIFGTVNRLTGEKSLLIWYPVLDLLFFLFNLSIVPLGLIARPTAWKNNREHRKTQRKTAFW